MRSASRRKKPVPYVVTAQVVRIASRVDVVSALYACVRSLVLKSPAKTTGPGGSARARPVPRWLRLAGVGLLRLPDLFGGHASHCAHTPIAWPSFGPTPQ